MVEIDKNLQERFLNELLRGNRFECSAIVRSLAKSNVPIKFIYEDLFKIALYEV